MLCSQVLIAAGALVIAGVQLVIYNALGGPSGGVGEQIAHYFEFTFEGLSGLISFVFCIDNKFMCDEAQKKLLQTSLMVGSSSTASLVPVPVGNSEPAATFGKVAVLKDERSDCCKLVPLMEPLLADYASGG